MPLAGFDSTIPASDLPQTYALDRAATGTGILKLYVEEIRLDEKYLWKSPILFLIKRKIS